MEKLTAAITIEPKPTTKSMPNMREPTLNLAESANDQVRIVGAENFKEAAQCLAEAFLDDDVAKYFIHTDPAGYQNWKAEDLRLHTSICEYITYAHCLKGLVTTTGPNYGSVALW